MKNSLTTAALCALLTLFASCRKDIPSDKLGFIGTWECATCGIAETRVLVIKADGFGSYESVSPGKTFNIAGNVKFDGGNFRIGGAIIKKKFKTNNYPKKEILSLKPYQYKWTASFNGENYLKTKE